MNRRQPPYIDKVPVEIWTEIFQLAFRRRSGSFTRSPSSPHRRQLRVSQTCRAWRDIIIDIPRFWSTIDINISPNDSEKPSTNISLINLWLDRSRDAPLSVDIGMMSLLHMTSGDIECHRAVFSHMARWKTAIVGYHNDFDMLEYLEALISAAPLLESLTVNVLGNHSNKSNLFPASLWRNSPRLHILRIDLRFPSARHAYLYGVCNWATAYGIPYGQLTGLFLDSSGSKGVQIRDLVSIFERAPNLVSCFVKRIGDSIDPTFVIVVSPVVLRRLRYLYLSVSERWLRNLGLTNVLDNLIAPSLRTMMLKGVLHWRQESYKRFITQSACPLEELYFIKSRRDSGVTARVIMDCVRGTPSLKKVHYELSEECAELQALVEGPEEVKAIPKGKGMMRSLSLWKIYGNV